MLDEVDHRIQTLFNFWNETQTPFNIEHFDSRYYDSGFRSEGNFKPFRKIGEEDQISFYNICQRIRLLNRSLALNVLPDALKEAEELIFMIKKEYQLK